MASIVEQRIVLPEPKARGPGSLERALAVRRSVRQYTAEPLTRAELGQLLWAAQGITDPAGRPPWGVARSRWRCSR
jgi:nitroreductase